MAKTLITTPFPSAAYIIEELGLTSGRVKRLDRLFDEIQRDTGAANVSANKRRVSPAVRRRLSAAARQRISLAQKRRWAEYRRRRSAAAK